MAKALRTAAFVVGAVALAATGVGLAVGAAAAATTTIGGLSITTIATAASVGSSVLALAASTTAPGGTVGGNPSSFKIDKEAGIPVVFGRTGVGGNVVHRQVSENPTGKMKNQLESWVTVLSLGPVKSVGPLVVDKTTTVAFTGAGAATGFYAGNMWLDTQLGACPESRALQPPFGPIPGWSASSKLSGLAADLWSLDFDSKGVKYPNGVPQRQRVVEGVLVYDPRQDSTYPGGFGPCRLGDESTYVYSECPGPHAVTWAYGRYQNGVRMAGGQMRAGGIDLQPFVEWSNVCDANGWRVGGQVYTDSDDAWDVLKMICQAGSAEPLTIGAQLSVVYSAPRVSIGSLTSADVCGDLDVPAAVAQRLRKNTIVPSVRLESHGWEMVPLEPVTVPAYVTLDGGRRVKPITYPLVQDADQGAELAMYDMLNARELDGIVIPAKAYALGYRPGDCLTLDMPDANLVGRDIIVREREIDVGTMGVTFTCRTEDSAKHDFALGKTGTPPPTPDLSNPGIDRAAPKASDWIAAGTVLAANGVASPAIVVTGTPVSLTADEIVFDYRPAIAGAAPDVNWTGSSIEPATITRKEITSVTGATQYDVGVRYRIRGALTERLILGPITTGETQVLWGETIVGEGKPADNATNSADPNSAFGPTSTVKEAIASLKRIEPIVLNLSDLQRAGIDQAAIQRQAAAALARIGEVLARVTVEQGSVRDVMREAGVRIDPDTKQIRIYGLDQVVDRTSKVEIALDAATAQISLRATRDYVNAQIALAQLTPGQAADLAAIIARITAAEVAIDGVRGSVALKADATTVTLLAGTVTSVSQTLDALAGVVRTKADSAVVDALGTRLGSFEQVIQALGPVVGITTILRQAQLANDKAGEALLSGVLGSDAAAQRQIKAAAEITQQLYAKITDDGAAEALARLALASRVGAAEAGLVEERLTRADAVSAQTKRVDLISADYAAADAKLAGQIATVAKTSADGDKVQADRTDQLQAEVRDPATGLPWARSAIADLARVSTSRDDSLAELIRQVTARIDGVGDVGLEQSFRAVVTRLGQIEGRYAVAIDANGNLIGFELIGGDVGPGSFNLINTDLRMGMGKIIKNNGKFMQVEGVAFGAQRDLIEWYGPTMAVDQCSRANALQYKGTDGSIYTTASLSAGTLRNSTASSSLAADAVAEVPLFGSNGRPVRYIASWSYRREWTKTYANNSDGRRDFDADARAFAATAQDGGDVFGTITRQQTASTITLSRAFSGRAYEQLQQASYQTQTLTMFGIPPVPGDAAGQATFTSTIGGGFTVLDPQQSAFDRTLRLALARGFTNTESGVVQRLTIVAIEE